MPPEEHEHSTSGILSGVFSFVSREIESFAVNAGLVSATDKDDVTPPVASSSRVKLQDKRKVKISDPARDEYTSRMHKSGLRHSHHRTSSSRRPAPGADESYPSSYLSLSRRCKVPHRTADFSGDEDELSGSDNSLPTMMPPPPNISHRSSTMPGALFVRSSSLEPTPEPDWERVRFVRFSDSSSTSIRYKRDTSGGTQQHQPKTKAHGRITREEYSFEDIEPHLNDGLKGYLSASSLDPLLPMGVARQRRNSATQESVFIPTDAFDDIAYPEINVIDASPEPSTVEQCVTAEIFDEQPLQRSPSPGAHERDKERIELLEAEVRRLREELAKRPVAPVPPPPPPPPPLVPCSTTTVPSRNAQVDIERSIVDARASLKRMDPPTERPINPVACDTATRSQRKGLPTLKVDNDKMAEFLNELKTHRLRKISNTPDGSFNADADASTSAHALRTSVSQRSSKDQSHSERSCLTLSRQRSLSQAGDERSYTNCKRKRPVDTIERGEHSGPSQKRRATNEERSMLSRSLTLPSRPEREVIRSDIPSRVPSVRLSSQTTNPVTAEGSQHELYLPTPSLCSDNDAEGSLEDRSPPTPPPPSVANASSNPKAERNWRQRPSIKEILTKPPVRSSILVHPVQRHDTSLRVSGLQSPEDLDRNPTNASIRSGDAFAKRPPTSPLPQDTPRRPRPPSRGKGNVRHVISTDALPSIDAVLSSIASRPDPVGGPPSPTEMRPQSRSISTVPHISRNPANASAILPRRLDTLQDELLRAEPPGITSLFDDEGNEDNADADFDRRTLSTTGTRDSKYGYLAHGGGGGAPAYVDNGGINVGGSRISDWRARVRERMSQSQLQTHRQSSSRQPLTKESRSSRRQ